MCLPKIFSRSHQALVFLLCLTLLALSACSSSGYRSGNWLESEPTADLSKFSVMPFSTSIDAKIPAQHQQTSQFLTRAIERQLQAENRLQLNPEIRSLTLKGIILTYQDEVLAIQGQVYDDKELLVYSRIERELAANENWQQGLEVMANQLLVTLLAKMSALQPPIYSNNFTRYDNAYYDQYYNDWDYWRQPPELPPDYPISMPSRHPTEITRELPRSAEEHRDIPTALDSQSIYTPPQSHAKPEKSHASRFIPPQSQSSPHESKPPKTEPKPIEQTRSNSNFVPPKTDREPPRVRPTPEPKPEPPRVENPPPKPVALPPASSNTPASDSSYKPPKSTPSSDGDKNGGGDNHRHKRDK